MKISKIDHMYQLTIVLICLFTWTGITAQTETQEFSLQEAIDYAVKHHNDFKRIQMEINDADYQIKEARSIGMPKLTGQLGYNYSIQIPKSVLDASAFDPTVPAETVYTEFPAGIRNSLYGKLELGALLFDYSYLIGLEAAKKLKTMTRKQVEISEQQIRNNVRDAYLPNLIVEVNEGTILKNIKNLEQIKYETQVMYDNGFVEQLDIDRLALSISNLNVQLKTLREQKEVLRNVLKFQMNYPLEDDISLTENISELLEDMEQIELEEENIYANRAEFVLFNERKEINEINLRRLKAERYPNAFGFAAYQQSMNRDNLFNAPTRIDGTKIGFIPSFVVGIQVNFTLFDGFKVKNSYQRALIDLDKIKLEEKDLKNAIELQVKNARVNYTVAKESLVTTDENLKLAEKIYSISKIKYREGVGSSLEISQAEQSLYSAQSNHMTALYNLLVAITNLNNALGNK